jgi:hypothetical protein
MKQRVMYLLSNAYQEECRKLNIQITPKRIQDYFLGIINEAVEYREKNNIRRNDYFDMLLQLKNEGKLDGDVKNIGKISYTDLTAACFVFFLAGNEKNFVNAFPVGQSSISIDIFIFSKVSKHHRQHFPMLSMNWQLIRNCKIVHVKKLKKF